MNSDDQRVLWSLRLPTSNQLCPFWELEVSPVPGVYNLVCSCEFAEWWSRVTWTLRTIWYFQCIFQGFTLCWPGVPLLFWRMSGELYFPGGSMVKTLLPMQEPWVQSLVGELRSHMPCSMAKRLKKKKMSGGKRISSPVLFVCVSLRLTRAKLPFLVLLPWEGNVMSLSHNLAGYCLPWIYVDTGGAWRVQAFTENTCFHFFCLHYR